MKNYNFREDEDVRKARKYLEKLIKAGSRCKMEETDTRTSKQNSALHLFYTMIANELNEAGATYSYRGVTGQEFETQYTTTIVKEFIWKPVQIQMYDIKSTTKLDTKKMNDIIDVIIKAFGSKGISLKFPRIETLMKMGFGTVRDQEVRK